MARGATKISRPALKHGVFSATAVLPGEDPLAFKKLHSGLVAELAPCGVLEEAIVANVARLMWRKQNLSTFWIAENARERYSAIEWLKRPKDPLDLNLSGIHITPAQHEAAFEDTRKEAQKQLGETLVFVGDKSSTIDRLVEELELEERLDSMIDRCLKRLLHVRGIKSLANTTTVPSSPQQLRAVGN